MNILRTLQHVRRTTTELCAPLELEDHMVQSMPDASPAKWHLAHTTWFFETFVLARDPAYRPFSEAYGYLFNSYYDGVGERHCRASRGLLSRPTLENVRAYRCHVDGHLAELTDLGGRHQSGALAAAHALALGIHHEQQHQELILTDIKHAFFVNPLRPAYGQVRPLKGLLPHLAWHDFPEGVRAIGHEGEAFAFDNEMPRHKQYLAAFSLASRLVTCGEFQAFVADRGYQRPELWLSDGWAAKTRNGWTAPLYWVGDSIFTLNGTSARGDDEPVSHVSYYEADAFARWSKARLPTEAEWEVAASNPDNAVTQLFGEVWQWTQTAYGPYPGFAPFAGAFGEYNGKFMCNQMVLRGSSCATPVGHTRASYRNFFGPEARWQFTGIRLARDP